MECSQGCGRDPVSDVSSLDDPIRRKLYDYVASRDEPTSRDQAASATAISRTLAAYHLDKLVEAGLLATSYARPPGRSGPGAGRPAKQYARAPRELTVSVPPREYQLAAEILAAALEHTDSDTNRQAITQAAHHVGTRLGQPDIWAALESIGYEPVANTNGTIELRNCPFHRLVRQHTTLVCNLNLDLITAMITASDKPHMQACLTALPDRCCVTIDTNPATPPQHTPDH